MGGSNSVTFVCALELPTWGS